MGILTRKSTSPETIDLTMLQKRGILKKSFVSSRVSTHSEVLDLTKNQPPPPFSPSLPIGQLPADPLSFLDAAAQVSSPTAFSSTTDFSTEMSSLKIKIDDLEFKLTQLLDKLEKLESQLPHSS